MWFVMEGAGSGGVLVVDSGTGWWVGTSRGGKGWWEYRRVVVGG